mgnify:CR=1 FL=1
MVDISPNRRVISLRLPEALAEKLNEIARSKSQSMNAVVMDLISGAGGPDGKSDQAQTRDIQGAITRDACKFGPESIGALKGIARQLYTREQFNLSAVVYTAAARVIAGDPDPERGGNERASAELTETARSIAATGNRQLELAITLAREAIKLDTNSRNRLAQNLLGQWLVRSAQRDDDVAKYTEARTLLADLVEYDSHAELFYGLAGLAVAKSKNDATGRSKSLGNVDHAMRRWAFGTKDADERDRWVKQLVRLHAQGADHLVADLVDFANANASWGPIGLSEIID